MVAPSDQMLVGVFVLPAAASVSNSFPESRALVLHRCRRRSSRRSLSATHMVVLSDQMPEGWSFPAAVKGVEVLCGVPRLGAHRVGVDLHVSEVCHPHGGAVRPDVTGGDLRFLRRLACRSPFAESRALVAQVVGVYLVVIRMSATHMVVRSDQISRESWLLAADSVSKSLDESRAFVARL